MAELKEHSSEIVKTDEVIGVSVENNNEESLGKIEEIILDKLTGQAKYVVLSFGGFLGLGNKLFALPWKAIHYNADRECFILNLPKSKLENAPGFDKDSWPDMADQTWGQKIHSYYGLSMDTQDTTRNTMGTNLDDKDINDRF